MSKLGVGVGDEFPIDDGKPAGEGATRDPGSDPEREARRAAWRRQRDEFREQRRQRRDQWRAEWRERKRAFKEEMRAQFGDEFDHDSCYGNGGHGRYWRGHHLFQALFILGLIMIVITLLNHLVVLFGLVVLAGLFLAYRGGYDHFDLTGSGPSTPPAPPADASKG